MSLVEEYLFRALKGIGKEYMKTGCNNTLKGYLKVLEITSDNQRHTESRSIK